MSGPSWPARTAAGDGGGVAGAVAAGADGAGSAGGPWATAGPAEIAATREAATIDRDAGIVIARIVRAPPDRTSREDCHAEPVHEHPHGPGGHHHHHDHDTSDPRGRRALSWSLGVNAGFTALQAAVGLAAGSVALLADAGHNLSDVAGLAVALWAARIVDRPATSRRTYGYRRAEVLAALANALTVVFMAGVIAFAAVRRLGAPPDVPGLWVAVTAAAGIAVNAGSVALIHRAGRRDDLNLRAALLHLGADALASAGVLAAGVLIWWRGWQIADPIAALAVAALVVVGSWGILRHALDVLLESAPSRIDTDAVGAAMAADPDVEAVHDLHVWSLSTDFTALSAHLVVPPGRDCHGCRRRVAGMLEKRFGIAHSTLQVEHRPPRHIMPGRPPADCHAPVDAGEASP